MLLIHPYPEEILNSDVELLKEVHTSTPLIDVKVLIWLSKQISGNILEIGTQFGHTTCLLAKYNPNKHIYTVDCPDPVVMHKDQRIDWPGTERGKWCKNARNVSMIQCDSKTLNYETFTNLAMVYIDGDHTYNGAKADSELALEGLKKSNAPPPKIIAWHDFIYSLSDNEPWHLITKYIKNEIATKMDVISFEKSLVCYTVLK
jgi:hypothetical protein